MHVILSIENITIKNFVNHFFPINHEINR